LSSLHCCGREGGELDDETSTDRVERERERNEG
jgi:hypothetical protein